MKSRMYGVIKDCAIIVFFVLLFYVITHNSIVRPHSEPAPGKWVIELRQRPLVLGIAGHNYLALRNDHGEIRAQLHGLPTDTMTGEWKYVGRNKNDVLRVWEFTDEASAQDLSDGYGIPLIATTEDEATALWRKAEVCANVIDMLRLPYPPFGVSLRKDTENSNSVAYTLVLCMNLETKHLGLFTPGWGKNLLENK